MAIFTKDGLEHAEILSFKIINPKYIESTKNSGNICLGCADLYSSQEELTGNRGQGDKDEGLFARIHQNNIIRIKQLERRYGGKLKAKRNGNFVDFKLRSVINMPIYCFYSINASDGDVESSDQKGDSLNKFCRTYKWKVPKKYFKDFSDKTENFGIMKFPNKTFICSRIEDSLRQEGCTQFDLRKICYVNRQNTEWCCPEDHPLELFYKDISFSHQREMRIIVKDNIVRFIEQEDPQNKKRLLYIGDLTGLLEERPFSITDIDIVEKVDIVEFDDKT